MRKNLSILPCKIFDFIREIYHNLKLALVTVAAYAQVHVVQLQRVFLCRLFVGVTPAADNYSRRGRITIRLYFIHIHNIYAYCIEQKKQFCA